MKAQKKRWEAMKRQSWRWRDCSRSLWTKDAHYTCATPPLEVNRMRMVMEVEPRRRNRTQSTRSQERWSGCAVRWNGSKRSLIDSDGPRRVMLEACDPEPRMHEGLARIQVYRPENGRLRSKARVCRSAGLVSKYNLERSVWC
jgi:hypothetical protein